MVKRKGYSILIFVLLLAHVAIAQHKSTVIQLMSATAQNWIAGASPGKSGTTYTIKLKILTERPIQFKNLWIDSSAAPFDLQTFTQDVNKRFGKGDSILLVSVKTNKPAPLTSNSKLLTHAYKGAALIEMDIKGKACYLTIDHFDKKKLFKGE